MDSGGCHIFLNRWIYLYGANLNDILKVQGDRGIINCSPFILRSVVKYVSEKQQKKPQKRKIQFISQCQFKARLFIFILLRAKIYTNIVLRTEAKL